MAFRHGILISPEQIRVLTADRTQFQINHDRQLFIQGQWITLSEVDTEVLTQYSQGMRKFVPQVVGIAVDSVELGLSAIESMLIGVGNPAQQEEWQALVQETTYQLMSRFVRSGEHFYL
ncbi:MAG: YggN family protein, partial [Gammaproteobacteria bacterium]|nr:YggN family protein [Gammaproteobacteria bacterium]